MSAVEKATVLASVATSPLSKRKVLRDLGVPKSTYYRWLRRQQHQQGLEDRPGASTPPWNRLRLKPESTEGRRVGGLLKKPAGAPLNLG